MIFLIIFLLPGGQVSPRMLSSDIFVGNLTKQTVEFGLTLQSLLAALPDDGQFVIIAVFLRIFFHGKYNINSLDMNTVPKDKQQSTNKIQTSLLDVTYPYYNQSLLAKSKFMGFEVLIFECGIYFSFVYTIVNYLNKGYFLKWDILLTIANNSYWDALAVVLSLFFAVVQIYLADLILPLFKIEQKRRIFTYVYSIVWLLFFVTGGLVLISTINFYFTDRILIVVLSWTFPVKTASYCIERIKLLEKKESLATKLLFILSPEIVFQNFIKNHDPKLPRHLSYLLIKSLSATLCLLINYILMTEIITPYLNPQVHGQMSFIQLYFRLTPLLFYVQMVLYYLIMENIVLAMAQITQLKSRHFYLDWWNAQTVSQFLDKWVLLINAFSNHYVPIAKKYKHTCHLVIIFIMIFSVFGERVNLKMLAFAMLNIGVVFFLGENKKVQNNYLVHFLIISFQPCSLALELKYNIFS